VSTVATAGAAYRGGIMSSIVKVIEVIAQSDKGFEDAARNAVLEASKSVKGIKSIWIDNFSAEVAGDKITAYRVNAKISFVLEGHK
jgi:dodecin